MLKKSKPKNMLKKPKHVKEAKNMLKKPKTC